MIAFVAESTPVTVLINVQVAVPPNWVPAGDEFSATIESVRVALALQMIPPGVPATPLVLAATVLNANTLPAGELPIVTPNAPLPLLPPMTLLVSVYFVDASVMP